MSVDYSTFSDSTITLPKPNGDIDQDVAFSTPGVDVNKNGVLSFRVDPVGTSTLEIKINGVLVLSQTFSTDPQRAWHENFSQSMLQTNNTLQIKVTGNGTINASDFYVMYKTV